MRSSVFLTSSDSSFSYSLNQILTSALKFIFDVHCESKIIVMRLLITTLVCLISVTVFSQEETRLALVIGNANYTEF